jgi:hypothetical protein
MCYWSKIFLRVVKDCYVAERQTATGEHAVQHSDSQWYQAATYLRTASDTRGGSKLRVPVIEGAVSVLG